MFNKFANSFTKATGVQVPGATTAQQQQQQQHNQQQAPQYQQQYQQQQYPYQQQHQAPPQYNYQQQQQQCSHPAGPKRAVLIGINYRYIYNCFYFMSHRQGIVSCQARVLLSLLPST